MLSAVNVAIEPDDARPLRVSMEADIDRASRPFLRVASCTKCRASWRGKRALAQARKHAAETGHVVWSATGRFELLLPKGWSK